MSSRGGSAHAMRVVRGVLLAGCSATLSTTAHAVGGGHLPHLLTTVAITVLIGWISTAIAERTRGFGGIALVLGGAQLITHLVLGELSGHVVGGPAMLAGHVSATVVTALLIARAEEMLAVAVSVLFFLRRLLVPAGTPARSWPVRRAVVRDVEGTLAYSIQLRRAHPRRGPPALS
ncbi:hypothetical protein [Saccharomonospora xinjiangensis]|uniref:Uncharacterized protein n=1 Tax=Saccharomonospora xinjiangensis XJ-54 TaxID=882086 RepID=I0V284_9PSEU|nr:hypothetical protein [Saccharomonospora xinjiangensis]EID54237.1 hypothetical protein SacxiDRAFT_2001 [Saccharomonospora xinjiangensis XJ-54]